MSPYNVYLISEQDWYTRTQTNVLDENPDGCVKCYVLDENLSTFLAAIPSSILSGALSES